ncbi:MAG: DEAD/SNF2-like helicase [Terrestrivirus sp.]|uniref:DEAD/SNF2-like helicase n=1 Tax=Terrestrivirus sp. TaxID=2487775 RepID=A0A3G4ZRP5_9VIRU|nr:MAG: DEAD/SNF2-like helicase [Terrestrivirus sp.]
MSDRQNNYIDLKVNGRLFPSYVLHSFPQYKLPEIMRAEGEDPCNITQSKELRAYQIFLSKYLDYRSPYHDALVFHGLGSGKTASAINIYNVLYNYTPGWNVFILIKAALRDHPWITDLQEFLQKEELEYRFKNIIFVSYDSPIADKQFLDAVKNSDTSKKSLYIVDEAHNFIRNVYSNINSKQGRRASTIYDHIINDKKENEGVRVILLSGTPAINTPYELALLFNLLRPGIFPKSETLFNQVYMSSAGYNKISDASKNMFQRRIMGLVSYYIGATPDLYASKTLNYVDVEMSDYQSDIYGHFEEIEDNMARQKKAKKGGSETYKSYTRQSCNFVFPQINQWVTGEGRPRPNKFRIDEKDADILDEGKGKLKLEKGSAKFLNVQKYMKELNMYVDTFDQYLEEQNKKDKQSGHTIVDDVKSFHEKHNDIYDDFFKKETKKSSLFEALWKSSAKMTNIVFNILKSPGPVLVYSNYVLVEGLQIFKVYLKYFGFSSYEDQGKGTNGFRYVEYHGGIDEKQRSINLEVYKNINNKHGKIVKIIMISPAGAEGISLNNVRQVHIMEPYWHEVRITQMIGRAIRQCSHKALPLDERHVDIYRYKSIRKKVGAKWTADQQIENLARGKEGLIQSFLDVMKEAAIDCVLNKAHNMMAQEYKCFQFEEPSLFDEQIGPAYKEDMFDDMKINNGSNSPDALTMKIKVMKISSVIQLTPEDENGNATYSDPKDYWYNQDTGTVYDYNLQYPVGKIATDENLPKKLDRDTYIIDKLIPVPLIKEH